MSHYNIWTEIGKLMDYWNDFDSLDHNEWKIFKFQFELIQQGKKYKDVENLTEGLDDE